MRIAYLIDHLRPDGTQKVLDQLVRGLGVRGHRQIVLCFNDSWDEEGLSRLQAAGAEVRIVGKIPIAAGYGLVDAWRWLRQQQCDVAVTFLFVSDVIGRPLARFAGIPRIISSIQTRDVKYSSFQRWMVRQTMHWVDVVHLCSESIREFAVSEEGASPERIVVIPNSIAMDGYLVPAERKKIRSELGLPIDAVLVGTVGRLTRQKGHDVLLRALAFLPAPRPEVIIAGAGEEEDSLRRLALDLGLEQHFHLIGYRRDVPRLLRGLDLYVQPSRFEGMPIALLEAMAAGCPAVATSVDGMTELITDGIHGWLVEAENPVALAGTLQEALGDLEERSRRAQAGRERIQKEFSLDTMIERWEQLLAGL